MTAKRKPGKEDWRAFAREQARIGKAERRVVAAAVKWRTQWIGHPTWAEDQDLKKAVDALAVARKVKP